MSNLVRFFNYRENLVSFKRGNPLFPLKFIPYKSFLYVIIILYHFIYFNNCIILSYKKLIITSLNSGNIRRNRIMWDIVHGNIEYPTKSMSKLSLPQFLLLNAEFKRMNWRLRSFMISELSSRHRKD